MPDEIPIPNESPWNQLDTDFTPLQKSPWEAIPESVFKPIEAPTEPEFSQPYTLEQIEQAEKRKYLDEVFLMKITNAMAERAKARAKGELLYEPEQHEDGWSASIQTSNGVVGLASLAQIQLVVPKSIGLSDTAIQSILEVEPGKPITTYLSYVTEDPKNDYILKRLKKEKVARMKNGIIIEEDSQEPGKSRVYVLSGENFLPAQFMSQPCSDGGRVWIDTKVTGYNFHEFPIVTNDGKLKEMEYEDKPNSKYSHLKTLTPLRVDWNKYTPDGARWDKEHLTPFRQRFLRLAAIGATRLGKPERFTINSAPDIFPQDLRKQGYQLEWLRGRAGVWKPKEGYRKEIFIRARKGNDFIFLESGFDVTSPWTATISREIPPVNSPEELEDFLEKSLVY